MNNSISIKRSYFTNQLIVYARTNITYGTSNAALSTTV